MGVALSTAPSFAGDNISIELQGEIEPQCRLSNVATHVQLGHITPAGSHAVNFGIHCNAPFRYTIRSQEGGLRHSGQPLVRVGFTGLIPYALRITIPTDTGGISDLCDSSQLSGDGACAFSHSGNGIALAQTAALIFSWSLSQEPIAGSYADVITISVQPNY